MRNGTSAEIEEEKKRAEAVAATDVAIVAAIASTSNMRAERIFNKEEQTTETWRC